MSPQQNVDKAQSVDRAQADVIAAKTIHDRKPSAEYMIIPDRTIEREFGWVYFYFPRRYLETHDRKFLVPGAGPLAVLRHDGTTTFLSTSVPPPQAIEIFEQQWLKATRGY